MITCEGGNDFVFTKAGAFIGGECYGSKNYKFTKVMLGPEGGIGQALLGQIARRFTGENLPLMSWLQGKIFPFEAQLTAEDMYYGCLMGTAEMLR